MKLKKTIVLSLLALTLIATTGCNKKSDDNGDSPAVKPTIGNTEKASSLIGYWNGTDTDGSIENVHFTDSVLNLTSSFSESEELHKGKLTVYARWDIKADVDFNYSILVDTKKSSRGYDSLRMLMTQTSSEISMTPTNDIGVNYFNDNKICGSLSWELDIKKTFVTGDCSGDYNNGDESKVILNVTGDYLHVGSLDDTNQTIDRGGYPDKLDLDFTLKRFSPTI